MAQTVRAVLLAMATKTTLVGRLTSNSPIQDEGGLGAPRCQRNTARDPGAWLPGMIFPLVLAAIYGAQFSRATELPGFPEVDSFLQFILPAANGPQPTAM